MADAQTQQDRQRIADFADAVGVSYEKAAAALKDVAAMVPRATAGVTNTGLIRPLRAVGADVPYFPMVGGGDGSSMTPYFDALRAEEGKPRGKLRYNGNLFSIGEGAINPLFSRDKPEDPGNDLARELQKAEQYPQGPALAPETLPQPTPEDRALQLTALGLGGGASASYRGGPGMAKVAGPKRYDVEAYLKQLESLPLPKQREALAALQAANPEVNRENFKGKDDTAMRGVSDALLAMAGGLADPNKSFAQSLVGAGERGFKSYDDREDKAVKEQMAARLAKLSEGKELNDAERADYNAQSGKLAALGKGYGDLNKGEIDLFSARSNDASRRAQAGIQSASLAQQSAARGAAVKQKEAMLELALNAAEGGGATLIPGRKGFRPATQKDILAASMALLGKEGKRDEDDKGVAHATQKLIDRMIENLPPGQSISPQQAMAALRMGANPVPVDK